ncbi:MAG: phosphatase PAP2 family protein [Pseudonocardiaceae bacterium]|nr:phosphatase PAP2 family protein [Pseudonocardiaceae bacterium]
MIRPAGVRRRVLSGVAVVAVLALAAVVLTYAVVGRDALAGVDGGSRDWVIAHRTPVLTEVMVNASRLGSTPSLVVIALLVATLLVWRGRKADSVLVVASTTGVLLLGPLLKYVVERPRPAPADQLVLVISSSYPSGHSLNTMAVFGLLTVLAVREWPGWRGTAPVAIGTLLIGTVGLSRVYLGVHWASDVLGGWLIGLLWLTLSLTVEHVVRGNSGPSETVREGS